MQIPTVLCYADTYVLADEHYTVANETGPSRLPMGDCLTADILTYL